MDSTPVMFRDIKKRFLLGIVRIHYYVENRRPDLKDGEYNGKYKHFLSVYIFWKQLNWTFRTNYPYESLPYINGEPSTDTLWKPSES